MKIIPALLAASLIGAPLHADPASHRRAAEELVTIVAGPDSVKVGLERAMAPMYQSLRQRGAPPEMIKDFQVAMDEWYAAEIKWDELRPKIASVYAEAYTEAELKDILAFLHTPSGAKLIQNTSALMQKSMLIGQQYASTKQASLHARIKEIQDRYAQAAPATPAAPAPLLTVPKP